MVVKRKNNIKVIKDPIDPETPEILAASIIKIGDAMEQLTKADGLTDDAVVSLICSMKGNYGLRKDDVHLILDSLHRLKSYYIRKTPRKS